MRDQRLEKIVGDMTIANVSGMPPLARLLELPRTTLGAWPTPLHRLDRLGRVLGCEIWAKRDDVQGVALAGNKVRKFELAIGEARQRDATTLVTGGAIQSNSARTGAAAAAAAGMDAVLLLAGRRLEPAAGNLLLDELVGAELHFVDDLDWDGLNEQLASLADRVRSGGGNPYVAPVGCSSPTGTLGFALGFLELHEQLSDLALDPEAIVHASTSGGTHAGLLVGRALTGRRVRIIGIDAAAMYADVPAELAALAAAAGERIGLDHLGDDVDVRFDQLGDGYAIANDATRRAIRLFARTEAIICDPIYSGKGAAGLIDLIERRELRGPVVFWHTGGYHALFDPQVSAGLLDS